MNNELVPSTLKRRHSNITIRTAEHLSYCRAVASSPKVLDNVLEQALVDNGLQGLPSQIFKMDETEMPLDPDLPRVVAGKGQKHVSCVHYWQQSANHCCSCMQCSRLCTSCHGYFLP